MFKFQEHRSYEFQPHLSKGKQYDQIVIPNIPMLTAAKRFKDLNYFFQMGINAVFSSTKSGPFKVQALHTRISNNKLILSIKSISFCRCCQHIH